MRDAELDRDLEAVQRAARLEPMDMNNAVTPWPIEYVVEYTAGGPETESNAQSVQRRL